MTPRAFQALHDQCRDQILFGVVRFVGNMDEAEDITADAFATAFQKRRHFRGESRFSTWVYRIAINRAISERRKRRLLSLDALEGPPPPALIQPDLMDQIMDRATCCHRLRRALRTLPAMYRRVLVDHIVRGHAVQRIAREQGIPFGTVLSRIFNGKRLLRKAWEDPMPYL